MGPALGPGSSELLVTRLLGTIVRLSGELQIAASVVQFVVVLVVHYKVCRRPRDHSVQQPGAIYPGICMALKVQQ